VARIRAHRLRRAARASSRRELAPLEHVNQQRERALEDLGEIPGRQLMPEQSLGLTQQVMGLLVGGELDTVTLGRQRG